MAQAQAAVDDHATVWVSDAGAPDRLVWRGQRWLVIDRPTLWVKRDRWWDRIAPSSGPDATRTPPSAAGFPVWRAHISPADDEGGTPIIVDIAHRDDTWVVLGVTQ